MLFIIDGAVYAAASPLIGFLLDRSNRSGTRKYIKNEHRVLEPSLCLLGGTATIGLGFAILASPPLILSPSLTQVTYHLVFCLKPPRSVWVLDCMALECLLASLHLSLS